jgi:hypothetical protein
MKCFIRENCAKKGGCRGEVKRRTVTMTTLNKYLDKQDGDTYSMELCDSAVEIYKRAGARVE